MPIIGNWSVLRNTTVGRLTVTLLGSPESALWMSVDSANLMFKGVLNRIREANVAEIQALRLNCRIRLWTPISDKAVKKRRSGDVVAFGQIRTSDANTSL
jgi:hypothetical protein